MDTLHSQAAASDGADAAERHQSWDERIFPRTGSRGAQQLRDVLRRLPDNWLPDAHRPGTLHRTNQLRTLRSGRRHTSRYHTGPIASCRHRAELLAAHRRSHTRLYRCADTSGHRRHATCYGQYHGTLSGYNTTLPDRMGIYARHNRPDNSPPAYNPDDILLQTLHNRRGTALRRPTRGGARSG